MTIDTGRRGLIRGGLSLGALTLLTGCDVSDSDAVQNALHAVSRWNDRVQAALFGGTRLAPEFPASMAVRDFKYNSWYPKERAPALDADSYRLQLGGLIADKKPWKVHDLYALPQKTQVTRHVCVEGWSMIGEWSGTPLRVFLQLVGADMSAKYVGFESADGYYEAMDMPSALHPQTIMAFRLSGDILPRPYGYPFKIRAPVKLGFKQPKWVTTIFVSNSRPPGFWSDRGYNWFSGS